MRKCSQYSAALTVLSFVFAAHSSQAVAPIEFAKSTIQFAPSAEPATPSARPAPQQPAGQNLEQVPQQPEYAPPRTAAPTGPAPRPVANYPVRQTAYAAPNTAPSLVHAPTMGRAPTTVNAYASANAQATLNKIPRPAPVQPRQSAPRSRLRGKPFQSVQSEPAISPYLNMYRRDIDNNLPNYFAFVRPQLQQQEANRQQAAELQQLRGQLQNLSSGSGAPNSASMTAHAHYMDTAQFYKGLRR